MIPNCTYLPKQMNMIGLMSRDRPTREFDRNPMRKLTKALGALEENSLASSILACPSLLVYILACFILAIELPAQRLKGGLIGGLPVLLLAIARFESSIERQP